MQPGTQQTIVVQASGNCPSCRVGNIIESGFTVAGILFAIFLFPCGLICLFCLKDKKCSHCGSQSTSCDRPFDKKCMVQKPVHSEAVTCVAGVRAGLVVTGSRDTTLALVNYETGECLRKWRGHNKEVTKVAYKQGGGKHLLFSGSRDASILFWQFGSPDPPVSYTGHEFAVTGLAIMDENTLCSGSRDNTLKLWDISTGKCLVNRAHSRNLVTHIVWSKAQRFLAQTSEDKELKFWDGRDLNLIHTFPKKQYIQTHCDISADGLYCLSTSNGFNGHGCEISLYDVRQRKILREFHGHDGTVYSGIFLNQQVTWKRLMLSVSADHSAKLWNLDDGACVWTEYVPSGGALLCSVGFNDGSVIIGGECSCICQMKMNQAGSGGKLYLHNLSMQIKPSYSHSHSLHDMHRIE